MLALGLLAVAGCRSTSGSRGSGCGGGGCCGGKITGGGQASIAQPAQNAGAPGPALAQNPYGGQRNCPVTGEALGSMGPPIPVNVQGQTVYVCCQGCSKRLLREPDKYLAKVAAERGAQ